MVCMFDKVIDMTNGNNGLDEMEELSTREEIVIDDCQITLLCPPEQDQEKFSYIGKLLFTSFRSRGREEEET